MSGTKVTPSDSPKCPQCGTPLPAGALAGLCPACLLKQGAADETATGGQSPPFHPPSVAELAPKFPQLEILELVGKGGMGAVYKARQKELDRIVALKILPPGIGDDPAFAGRFAREAKALAKLNHPGIVTLYEFGRAELPLGLDAQQRVPASSLYYFLMEFVDGVNLRQLLHTGRIAPREALAIVPQICDALQYAHDQGIVHRDIKPENILLDRRGRVKVADFGLAKLVGAESGRAGSPLPAADAQEDDGAHGVTRPTDALTVAGKVMGTPNYMAPEQKEHPDAVDHRADIYALGVVFYQMLTGELPGKPIVPPSSCTRGMVVDVRLDEVVLRALEKKPELRYQQASVLKTQVETIAQTPAQSSSAKLENQGQRWLVGTLPTTPFSKAFGWIYIIFFAGYFLLLVNDHFTGSVDGKVWRYFGYCFIGFAVVSGVELLFRIGRAKKAKTPEMSRVIQALLKPMLIGGSIALLLGAYVGVLHTYPSRPLKSDYTGQSWFPAGDSIGITSVERSTNRMVVKGHYNLVSHEEATLEFHITTATDIRVPEDSKNRVQISKGHGDFELVHSHLVPGLPHVSMYAGGRPFATLYFGTQAEALEESKVTWIAETNPTSGDALEPTSPASAFQIRLVAEDSETNIPTDILTNYLDKSHFEQLRVMREVLLDGKAVERAGWNTIGSDGQTNFTIGLTETGSRQFETLTAANLKRHIAIVFQGRILLAPVIQGPISSGRIELPVAWDKEDLERTVNGLNWMKTPAIDLRFGPEQESILPPLQGPEWSFLNLRANQLVTNSHAEPGTRAFRDWQRDNNADLAAPISDKFPALRGYGMVITTADTNGWDTSTPSDIWYNWNLMVNEPKAEVHLAKAPGKASGIYYFRTRDDTWGILQIIGFTKKPGTNFMENPSSVRVRYKLVQNGSQPSGDGLESKAFTAQFLQGQIRLLGVSRFAFSNSNWWRPDGSISSRSFEAEWNHSPASDSMARLVFETRGFPNHSAFLYKVVPETCSTSGQSSEVRSGGKRVPGCDMLFVKIPKPDATNALKQFNVQIGVASGPGKVISTRGTQGGSSEGTSLPDGTRFNLMSTSPIEGKDFVSLTYFYSTLPGWDAIITAVDNDGKIHEAASSGTSDNELATTEARFGGLKLSDVKEFRFAVRRYEWMEFHNISLLPGHHTDVEVRNAVKEQKQENLMQNGQAANTQGITTFHSINAPADLCEARAHLAELRVNYADQSLPVQKALARVKELERMLQEEPNASAELREAKAHLAELRLEYAETTTEVQGALAQVKELEFTSYEEPNSTGADMKNNAQAAAMPAIQAWLGLMDNGQYAESWQQASIGFRALVTQDEWVNKGENIRKPLGKLLFRKVVKMEPNGPYFAAQFESSFEGMKPATETVTLTLETNGHWQAAGYLIRPRSNTNNAAVEPTQTWLRDIDAGHYAQSWTNAATSFQLAITPEKWMESMQAFRQPLGSLISRKVISAQEMSSLPGAPDGRYIVMQFETSFANKQSAVETVTFLLEKDGQWKAAGYYIK